MARKIRDSRLESRSARLRLPIQKKTYSGPALARGIHLLYRRNQTSGSWVVKSTDGHGSTWTKAFAVADDFEEADGQHVMTFHQAGDAAKALARGKAAAPDSKPLTVGDALIGYEADLRNRGAHLANVTRVAHHMTPALAGKPVGLLTARDLKAWRDGLIGRMEASSIRRTCVGLRAALELAASLDHRIMNRHVFRLGLKALPGSNRARRMVLPNADVLRVVEAAYQIDPAFGLLVEVRAVTGARISQAARRSREDRRSIDRPQVDDAIVLQGAGGSEADNSPAGADPASSLRRSRGSGQPVGRRAAAAQADGCMGRPARATTGTCSRERSIGLGSTPDLRAIACGTAASRGPCSATCRP
jgi:hypothetical protein